LANTGQHDKQLTFGGFCFSVAAFRRPNNRLFIASPPTSGFNWSARQPFAGGEGDLMDDG